MNHLELGDSSPPIWAPPITVAIAARFETEQGKLDCRKHKWIGEPPNGWIKSVLGFRQFSMQGLEKTKAELSGKAHQYCKIHAHEPS